MSIMFYPTISAGELGKYAQVPRMLLPASSWAGAKLRQQERAGLPTDRVIGDIPAPKLPACAVDVVADCGGFVATRKWGDYKYDPAQYVRWLSSWSVAPTWAAMMDYCCEDEITSGRPGIVRERQDRTTKMAHFFWKEYRDCPWVWVPTIQGWLVPNYERHAREMKPLIDKMQAFYAARGQGYIFRVGIGTLCARANATMIQEVVLAVLSILEGIHAHLWGVKRLGWVPDAVISCDSGAWNGLFAHGRNEWKLSGLSQREWCFKVALPRYEQKFYAQQELLNQARMF